MVQLLGCLTNLTVYQLLLSAEFYERVSNQIIYVNNKYFFHLDSYLEIKTDVVSQQ